MMPDTEIDIHIDKPEKSTIVTYEKHVRHQETDDDSCKICGMDADCGYVSKQTGLCSACDNRENYEE